MACSCRDRDPCAHSEDYMSTVPYVRRDQMKTFHLYRDHDVSGVSGTGVVADGVVFPDGVTVIRWRGERQSTVVWPSIEDVEAIHGHGGATRIVWDTSVE